jgi:hypothetical protein
MAAVTGKIRGGLAADPAEKRTQGEKAAPGFGFFSFI